MSRLISNLRVLGRDVVVNGGINNVLVPRLIRSRLWSCIGHHVDKSATINPNCYLGANKGLSVGKDTFINYECFFDLGAATTIGSGCSFGYQTMLVTCSHDIGDRTQRAGLPISRPIVIGDGVWLGARVTVMPGVTIGSGCVVAAGSTVVEDCEPNSLYAGVPAQFKRSLLVDSGEIAPKPSRP